MATMLWPHLLVMAMMADLYFDGTTANTIVETRGTSICTYRINNRQLSNPNCLLDNQDFAVALAVDADEELIFFSDIVTRKIFQYRRDQQPVQLLYGLGSVEGIAVDWRAKNLYWTDFLLSYVCVSRYDGRDRSIIVSEDVLNPRGIVVDPFDGFIFWTDLRGVSDQEGRIERSDMDGSGRFAIVDENLISPSGLVIDFEEKRLYFADRGTDTIESVTYDGQDRRVLYQRNGADFFDITIYGGVLYATVWQSTVVNGSVMAISKQGNDEGQVLQTFQHPDQALGIATLDEDYQPEEMDGLTGACGDNNGRCDHLCLPTGAARRACACATGYQLANDRKSCETYHTTEHFILVADSSLNTIYQVDAATTSYNVSALPLGELDFPVAIAYDHVDGMVYWTDRALSAIGRAKLDGSMKESVLFGNIIDPAGVALDTRRRLVYWTDEERDEIGMAGMDGILGSRVFIDQDLDEPRAIAVNLLNGDVYWTDWGVVAKIERVSSDGTNRKVLVQQDLGWPNCLAIDSQEEVMYWCDALHGRIEMSDLDGTNRMYLVTFSGPAHPFSLAIYGDFIYWTDWLRHRLSRADRWTGGDVEEVGEAEFLRMQGLAAFEVAEIFAETTTAVSEGKGDFTKFTTYSLTTAAPPMNGALNLPLVIGASGGGLALILVVILVCCVVKCARSKGGRGSDDHVPMSVRSTSFVGSYDPSGLPGLGQINNNPPALPPARKKSDPIYEDIDEYQKSKGGEAAYQAYLNPSFGGAEDDEKNTRYVKRITPENSAKCAPQSTAPAPPKQTATALLKQTATAPPKQTAPAPLKQTATAPLKQTATAPLKQTATAPPKQTAPTPLKQTATAPPKNPAEPRSKVKKPAPKPPAKHAAKKASTRPDETYLTPNVPPEQDYMALRLQAP
ncbi:low-density lipoprotein receptor-related protein 6-like [Acanthaster planci]|uniref:Low-density lipoprotein receptor-related protein 6-like n=1 Tax=Acanthaster planci TaxID=133434 RepID=A0A8B7XY98_ACAPL|nr:low-density lipoprotein receptor-related protein 6-like [Acanthaster planci]